MAVLQQISPDKEMVRSIYGYTVTGSGNTATQTLYVADALGRITVTDASDIAFFKSQGWIAVA
jgi:hypothetical protein